MSATTAQEKPHEVLAHPAQDPFPAVDTPMDGIVPIPMPPLTHPAGELVHPWED